MVPLERVEERRGKISSIPQDQLFFFVEIWRTLLSRRNNVLESLAKHPLHAPSCMYFILLR